MQEDARFRSWMQGGFFVVVLAVCLYLARIAVGAHDGVAVRVETAPASSCPLVPCRDEAMSVIDSDGQRIECSSERHTLRFSTVGDRVFAFCRCAGGGPAGGGAAADEDPGFSLGPVKHPDPTPKRRP